MPNYKETSISGSEYQRARLITITNEHNSPNTITFIEEKIKFIGTEHYHMDVSKLSETLTQDNASTTIDLLNPVDDSVIGSATYQQLYILMYSLYMKLANERDAQPVETLLNPSVPAE